MTFPKNVGQIPIYYNHKNTGRPVIPAPNQVFWSHYIDESNEPLYEFGYGLSYTQFKYNNISLDKNILKEGDKINIRFTLSNIGDKKGCEVVQLYIRDLYASVTRPVKELKSFKKITLSPGESKEVHFELTKRICVFTTIQNGQQSLDNLMFILEVAPKPNWLLVSVTKNKLYNTLS